MEEQRINIDVKKHVWRDIGIIAAERQVPKKQVIDEALQEFIKKNK